MSDDVWWAKSSHPEATVDIWRENPNGDEEFSHLVICLTRQQWIKLGGDADFCTGVYGPSVPIRPLRIERVEVQDGR